MSEIAGRAILVVEDEALVLAMAEEMLSQLGAKPIHSATSLEAALALVRTVPIDIALLDVNIRGAPVDPVAEALKAKGIPFVFATAYGQAIGALEKGTPLIDKPYNEYRLASVLSACLRDKPRT